MLNWSNVLQDRFIIPPPTPPKNKYSQQYLLLTPPNNSSPLPFSIAPLYESTINKTKQIIITQLNDLPQSTKQQLIICFIWPHSSAKSLYDHHLWSVFLYITHHVSFSDLPSFSSDLPSFSLSWSLPDDDGKPTNLNATHALWMWKNTSRSEIQTRVSKRQYRQNSPKRPLYLLSYRSPNNN